MMESVLEKIRDFADRAHGTQMRKYTPERYIVHPVRVMETCRQYDPQLSVLAAALLHDVLEDTPVGRDEMSVFLRTLMSHEDAEKTLLLVEELTDVYIKADYPQWNRKTRKEKELERITGNSREAQTIKYADILDNCREISSDDPGFARRYLSECLAILKKADKGNKDLHKIALKAVRNDFFN
jgi:(p)ppGpp synthase/HD superfamily hydrolase